MKESVIYLIRHGEAKCNINVHNKDSDDILSPLTNNGITQSIMAGEWFKSNSINIDLIYSSEMKRSIQTAELLKIDKPIITSKLLNERNMGNIKRQMENDKPVSIVKQFKLKPENYLSWRTKDGESQLDVIKRIQYFFRENNFENGLIVAHGYVIYAIRSMFLGITESCDYLNFVLLKGNFIRNCQIYKLIVNIDSKNIEEKSYYISEKNWVELNLNYFNPKILF